MKVNLKKAAALSRELQTSKISIPAVVPVGLYDSLPDFTEADERLQFARMALMMRTEAIYTIRGLIGHANEGDINALLVARASFEEQLKLLSVIPVHDKFPDRAALEAQQEALKASPSPAYGSKPALEIKLETATWLLPELQVVRRAKRKIDDELAELNYKTTIELPLEVVKVLTDHGLI